VYIDPYVTDGSLTDKMHILTGDFNCVLDKEIDRYPSRNYDDTGGKELLYLVVSNVYLFRRFYSYRFNLNFGYVPPFPQI
jgi:aminopeptidase-like protein